VEDFFRSAFGEQDCFTFRSFYHDRHHAPREVEGDLIELLILLDERLLMEIRTIQNRRVEQILEAGLEVTDDVTVQQHLVGFPSRNVAVPLQDHTILGQCAGLIRAQYIHPAKVLNGIEPLNDHFLAAHRDGALGEAHGDYHGSISGSDPRPRPSRRRMRSSNRAW